VSFYDQVVATARRPTARDTVRALWLLGLREPADIEEIRNAWRDRVAQAHPDRRLDNNEAATRLTAAFNDARDICERWAVSGLPWPEPGPRVVRLYDPDADEEVFADDEPPAPPKRVPTPEEERGERRAGLRPGDRVRAIDGEDVWRVRRVTAPDITGPVTVELEDGAARDASTLELAAYGCPVCGLCAGPAVEHPGRRPCPDCLAALRRLEREPGSVETVLSELQTRARRGVRVADELGDHGLGENARERIRWSDGVRRRPREERRGALLAAFAHGFAVWGNVGFD
jgi:hypothetical protein